MSDTPSHSRDTRASDWHGRVFALAWPTILANLTVPIVGAVDTAVVGHLGDARYIGAVALGAVLFTFMQWAFSFLRMGTTGFVAQAFGASDAAEINAIFLRAMVTAVAIGLAVVIFQQPLAWFAFYVVEGSAGLEASAQEYYDARIWSAPAALVNLVVLGTLFGLQRMRAALVIQLVLNALNIILDLWFVVGLGWGVAGVAWESTFAEYAASVVGLYIVIKALNDLGGPWRSLDLNNQRKMRAIWAVNANIFLRTLSVQVTFFYFAAVGARQGDVILAANAVLLHLFHFMAYGLDGFAFAVEALTGNAFGARNPRRLRAITIAAAHWSGVTAVAFAIVYFLAGQWMVGLITNVQDVMDVTAKYMPWMVAAPVISVWCYLFDGLYFGTTHTREARNSMVLAMAGYFPLIWLTMPWLGNHGLWLAVLTFMAIRGIALFAWYPRIERAAGDTA